MPRIIDYPQVLDTLTKKNLVCLYHNSGAFGFPEDTATRSAGWILADDPTIRPAARETARVIAGDENTLAAMAGRVWAERLGDQSVWVLPKSHWAYELDFGSASWMPAALAAAGVEPDSLLKRHDGAAIEFSPAERTAFETFIAGLLSRLAGSDFNFVFSGGGTICTVHHHKQLWWTSTDAEMVETP